MLIKLLYLGRREHINSTTKALNSGRPGGMTVETFDQLRKRVLERIIEHAVRGMLPEGGGLFWFICQKVDGRFKFSPISANFLMEVAKVLYAVAMIIFQARRHKAGEKPLLSVSTFIQAARSNVLLAVPAFLYAINNYLKFIMQLYLNPATVKMSSNRKVNADKVAVSGKKRTQKLYHRHSRRPGGMTVETFDQLQKRVPERIIVHAVHGMLPKGRLYLNPATVKMSSNRKSRPPS